jgi:hypothetical protein
MSKLLLSSRSIAVKVRRKVTRAILIRLGRPVAQAAEAVLAPPRHVEVLAANLLEAALEVHHGTGVQPDDAAVGAAVLVAGAALA